MAAQPGQIGNIVPKRGDPGAMMRMIRDLQADVKALQGALTVNSLTVTGTPGIAIQNGGTLTIENALGAVLPLSQLAFGLSAVETAATFTCAGNGVFRTDTLESTQVVAVTTGRLIVIVSAVLFSSVSASNAVMSWTLTGPTNVAASNQRALVAATAGFPAAGYASGSYTYLHTGLTDGNYTIQANYRCDQYGGTADSALFENRSVIALPF